MNKFLMILAALQFASCLGFEIQSRIVNGRRSLANQFPSYVYLETVFDEDYAIAGCGGTLISDR